MLLHFSNMYCMIDIYYLIVLKTFLKFFSHFEILTIQIIVNGIIMEL